MVKVCPISEGLCKKNLCAWYDEAFECCAVKSQAIPLRFEYAEKSEESDTEN